MLFLHFLIVLLKLGDFSLFTDAAPQQIDAVLLDELLRDIVDNSMSELRHRLQEAVFASAFRRRIQSATSSLTASSKTERDPTSAAVIDKFLDEYMKKDSELKNDEQRKMSLALETFTTTRAPVTTEKKAVELITAESVEEGSKNEDETTATGRMFDDADSAMKEPVRSWQSQLQQMPRVPVWVAITVCTICIICFCLLIASLVFYLAQRKRKRQVQLVRRSMPDPLTVAGLCHSSDCISSRRSSYIMDQDRGGGSILWANS